MKTLDLLNKINVLLTRFETEVSGQSSMGFTDIHKASEKVLLPILKLVYDLPNLQNLNKKISNHPAVDLGDKTEKISFQITSDSSTEKIERTLETFFAHSLDEQYETLIFFFLSPKKNSYPKKRIEKLVDSQINFNPKEHIKDFNDLRKDISEKDGTVIEQVLEKLQFEFGESKERYHVEYEKLSRNELLYPNLLQVKIPDKLFVADYLFDRESVVKKSKDSEFPLSHRASARNVAKAAMAQSGLGYPQDWIVHNKQVITFHDLDDPSFPLSSICDPGTITALSPKEFYGINEDLERVFKNLLWRCLQQMLYKNGVQYQNQVGLFIFTALDEEDERKEKWFHKKKNERTVFKKVMRKKDPEKLDAYTHFAFDTKFELINTNWYLLIKPDWFFSKDGYKKSYYSSDKVTYKKKNENNKIVYDHFNFLSYFFRNLGKQEPDLFRQDESSETYFLKFQKADVIEKAPNIDDEKWITKEPKERKNILENNQFELVV